MAGLELGRVETIRWKERRVRLRRRGDVSAGFRGGQEYPLVLYIHRRPRIGVEGIVLGARELLAAQSWVVFEPNYRGSDNLGNKFQAAIWNDAGAGPGRDVDGGVGATRAARLCRSVAHGRERMVVWRVHDDLAARQLSDR